MSNPQLDYDHYGFTYDSLYVSYDGEYNFIIGNVEGDGTATRERLVDGF